MPIDYAPPRAPDFTVPSRAGGVVLSAENRPVTTGPEAAAGPPGPATPSGRGAAPSGRGAAPAEADPSYIWDLAATDVFPAATSPGLPETPEAPGAVPEDDDPGAN